MPAQKREARRNYIDLVSGECERGEAVRAEPVPAACLKDCLLRLVADILRARNAAN